MLLTNGRKPAGMGKTTFIKNLFASYARDPDFKVASASTPTSREARLGSGQHIGSRRSAEYEGYWKDYYAVHDDRQCPGQHRC